MEAAQEDGLSTEVLLVTANVGSLFEDVSVRRREDAAYMFTYRTYILMRKYAYLCMDPLT